MLTIKLLLPDRILASQEAKSLILPTSNGQIGILENHADMVSEIGVGKLTIEPLDLQKEKDTFFISGGYVQVSQNKITVFADVAEHQRSIDVSRAEAAKQRAQKRLENRAQGGGGQLESEQVDVARAQAALMRALYRLSVAAH